ncbi:MAG: GDYXXLXY domain-containing protein [Candidatus Omnitrophica bacterium]|nr:GDYXXLXY domain-containing protein [Candidatus Omnitrophota bacterium]
MLTKQTKFILAIALQVVIIFAIIIFKLSVLAGGTDVLLKIAPVDPRDLLRGDYVTFQYDISSIDSHYANRQQIRNGDAVYVVLRQTGKYWMVQGVQKNQPTGSELFIKGKVESGGLESQTDPFSYQRFGDSRIHVIYGVEQYFIPEGEGRNFSFWNKEAAARVAVDDNGNAALKQIYVNDKPWP